MQNKWILIAFALVGLQNTQAEEAKSLIILSSPEYEDYMLSLEKMAGKDNVASDKLVEVDQDFDLAEFEGSDEKDWPRRYKRLKERILLAQARLAHLMEEFVKTDFDPQDDDYYKRFREIREEIVKLLFFSETERTRWERLYIIHKASLEHPNEFDRFLSLREAIVDRKLERENYHRQIRQWISLGGTVIGGLGGGYAGYKLGGKILKVNASAGSLRHLFRYVWRVSFVGAGAFAGMQLGGVLGHRAGRWLFDDQLFMNPVMDQGEDLQLDLLRIIDKK